MTADMKGLTIDTLRGGVDSEPHQHDSADENSMTRPHTPPTHDTVHLSQHAQWFSQLDTEIHNLSDIDQKRVDDIKAKMASGAHHINAMDLAAKILAFETE